MKQFRIERVKVVSARMLDEHGEPTGELFDIVDVSECLFDSNLEGKELWARQLDEGRLQWVVDTISCD